MIEDLKKITKKEGLDKWQTYMKMVLKKHIKEKKPVKQQRRTQILQTHTQVSTTATDVFL